MRTRMRRHGLALVVSVTALFALIAPTRASTIVFNNDAAFIGATGATNATVALPNDGVAGVSTRDVGSIRYNQVGSSTLFFGFPGISALPGNILTISDVESFEAVMLGGPVFSFGFYIDEPDANNPNIFAPFVDSTFTVSLYSGASSVGNYSFNPEPENFAAFTGVWSSSSFDRVVITETIGGVENEFFGNIYTGTNAPASVAEPSALLLLGIGLVGLCGISRRRGL